MNKFSRFGTIGLLSAVALLTGTGCAGDFYPGGGAAVRSYSSPYSGGYGPYYGETIFYGGGYGYHRGYYGNHHFYGRGYRAARIGGYPAGGRRRDRGGARFGGARGAGRGGAAGVGHGPPPIGANR